MRWRVPKIRPPQGRSRLGYGLPSLVVVLFFVSVLVQVIVSGMARETQEAKAEAAFSITKENLDTFKVTQESPDPSTMPHLAGGSRYVDIEVTTPIGLEPRITPTFTDTDSRSGKLFEQKLRGYVNVPNDDALGSLQTVEIRRKHPERVLRTGDRMATNLTSQNISGIGELVTGTAVAEDATAGQLTGIDTTLLDAETLEPANLVAGTLTLSGELTADTLVANQSIVSSEIQVLGTTQVYSRIQSSLADIDDVAISGQIAADNGLDGIDDLNFQTLTADGLRAGGVYTETFAATNITGQPDSGEFEGGNPVDDNEDDTLTDLEQCMADGGSFYDCVWGNTDDGDTGDDGSDDGSSDDDDDDSGDGSTGSNPYEICREIGMSDTLCTFYTGDFLTGDTMPYNDCISEGGTPLFCEMISGGSGGALGGDGNPMTPYEQCLYEGGTAEICSLFPDYFQDAPDDVVVDTTYEECRAAGGSYTFCTTFPSEDNTCYAGLSCGQVEPTYEECLAGGASDSYCSQFPEEYEGPTEYQCTIAGGTTAFCTTFPDTNGNCYYASGCDYSELTLEDCLLNGEGDDFEAFCAQFPEAPEEEDTMSLEQCIVTYGPDWQSNCLTKDEDGNTTSPYEAAAADFGDCVETEVNLNGQYVQNAYLICAYKYVEFESREECLGITGNFDTCLEWQTVDLDQCVSEAETLGKSTIGAHAYCEST